ncbi:PREDICTED: uncharacterized protein LOC105564352 [Vollenhovia emeryi]|uniref:uncharacterized protein LOC105564352 n=1 Tax=Vollenhovia emeryi TaxID=411798 RepID=UPI0005F4BDC8|nr:PREDICTED: uncharacterized protein LOC105564352 [Vollenhovia emeryi]XP_011872056.1 PREDICTED: uncharacterized protein LOC105564352 [Vollenhovia emeryi]XP_011872057.1 PREDICTED: uncharacterized protein LOC105564352 [Vollenhovia emeryi]
MAWKVYPVVLIVALLARARLGASAPGWESDLNESIGALTHNINQQVAQLTRNLNSQIEDTLRSTREQVQRTIDNLPRDAQGNIITTSGNSVISLSSGPGESKTIISGHTANGEPYVRSTDERTDGTHLFHNEVTFYPRTNTSEKINWKLDLRTPDAKPEIITDEN